MFRFVKKQPWTKPIDLTTMNLNINEHIKKVEVSEVISGIVNSNLYFKIIVYVFVSSDTLVIKYDIISIPVTKCLSFGDQKLLILEQVQLKNRIVMPEAIQFAEISDRVEIACLPENQWKIIDRRMKSNDNLRFWIKVMQCVVVSGATGLIVLVCNPNF
jgi:hypothetical protein